MIIRVHVRIDCPVHMYRVRIHNPNSPTQNWIKFYPSKELCAAELRYLGILTHIEASLVIQDDYGAHKMTILRSVSTESDVLAANGFVARKIRFSQTWRRGTLR